MKDILYSSLQQVNPTDCVPEQQQRIELLEKFNFHWQDWTFRDVVDAEKKYTEEQKEYFATKPSERRGVIEFIRNKCKTDINIDPSEACS